MLQGHAIETGNYPEHLKVCSANFCLFTSCLNTAIQAWLMQSTASVLLPSEKNAWEICVLLVFVLHCLEYNRTSNRHCGWGGIPSQWLLPRSQEWRHAHGMRCLGIPNTAHFANVTQIEDAVSRKSWWHFFAQNWECAARTLAFASSSQKCITSYWWLI